MQKQNITLDSSFARAFGTVDIGEQYRSVWSDGTTVISFPDGTIVREADASFVKKGTMGYVDVVLALLQRQLSPIDSYVDLPLHTAADTAVTALQTTSIPCRLVRFQAGSSNSGSITIGGTTLDATNGAITLTAGQSIEVAFANVQRVRVRATNASDTLAYSYAQ